MESTLTAINTENNDLAAAPQFRYGSGLSVHLAEEDWQAFVHSLHSSVPEIHADPRVKIVPLTSTSQYQNYFSSLVPKNENAITALHYAHLRHASVIVIPANTIIEQPLLISGNDGVEHFLIIAEENSRATIVQESKVQTHITEIFLHPDSNLTFCSTGKSSGTSSLSFVHRRAKLEQNSSITWIDVVHAGTLSQLQLRSYLTGIGAEAKTYTAFVGQAQNQCDMNIEAVHQARHTKSIMVARGVLDDQAKAIFRGTINIEKQAEQSSGHQRADALLLAENARCDAVPILDVENDQVSCSHGTSISQIDKEQLFYLLSRGLDEENAKRTIIDGFLEKVYSQIPTRTLPT